MSLFSADYFTVIMTRIKDSRVITLLLGDNRTVKLLEFLGMNKRKLH